MSMTLVKDSFKSNSNFGVILEIAREFGKYFEKLVDMFAQIGNLLPQLSVYEKLFPHHERLTHALSVTYVDILGFCVDAKAVFRRGQRASSTSLRIGSKLLWKPFETQFGQHLTAFRIHLNNVEKEAELSHMVEAADARALALANRLQIERNKKGGPPVTAPSDITYKLNQKRSAAGSWLW